MSAFLSDPATLTGAAASDAPPFATPDTAPAPQPGREAANPTPSLDLSIERLEAQDTLLWGGRALAELSDAELAAAARGIAAEAPAERASVRTQRNWLKLRVQWPQRRVHVHLRVDEIVLEWFRRDGAGFQGRMNAVLRAYVDAQIEAEQRAR